MVRETYWGGKDVGMMRLWSVDCVRCMRKELIWTALSTALRVDLRKNAAEAGSASWEHNGSLGLGWILRNAVTLECSQDNRELCFFVSAAPTDWKYSGGAA